MDWEAFLRRVYKRLASEIDPKAEATHVALTRAFQEAKKVAIQASVQTQLLRSGVLCVSSYLPQAWKDGTRYKVAFALLDEAGCRAYQDKHNRQEENDWCLTASLPIEGIDLRLRINRYTSNQDLPEPIKKYITRLECHSYLVEGEARIVSAKVVPGDYRAYTTLIAKSSNITFQSMPSKDRAQVCALIQMIPNKPPTALELVEIDIRASQLKLALALRGCFYPIELDAWTSIADATVHTAKLDTNPSEWRKVVKTIALTLISESRAVSIRNVWRKETDKFPKEGQTKGLKAAVRTALLEAFPEMQRSFRLTKSTPDGVPIHGPKVERKFSVRGSIRGLNDQAQKIETSYDLGLCEQEPDVRNVLTAYEAWLIRETIFAMPTGLPMLPVHDQLYFPEGFKDQVTSMANNLLMRLANGNFKHEI